MSEALTKDIIIRILTAYEQGGAEAAKKALDDVKGSSSAAGDGMSEAAHDATALSAVLQGVSSTAAGSAQGLFQIANGVRGLMGGLSPLIGQAGLLAATFMASYAAASKVIASFQEQAESADKYAARIAKAREEHEKLAQAKLDTINSEYDDLTAKITAAAEAQASLTAAMRQMNDAKTAAALLDIDIREKQALAGIDPADAIGRDQTRLAFQNERDTVSNAAALQKAQADASEAAAAASKAEALAAAAAARVKTTEDQVASLRDAITRLTADIAGIEDNPSVKQEDIMQTGPGGIPVKVGTRSVYDTAGDAAEVAKLRAQMAPLLAQVAALQADLAAQKAAASASSTESQAAGISSEAAAIRAGSAARLPQGTSATAAATAASITAAAAAKQAKDAKDAAAKQARDAELAELRGQITQLQDQLARVTSAEFAAASERSELAGSQTALDEARSKPGMGRMSKQSSSYQRVLAPLEKAVSENEGDVKRTAEAVESLVGAFGDAAKMRKLIEELARRVKQLENSSSFGGE